MFSRAAAVCLALAALWPAAPAAALPRATCTGLPKHGTAPLVDSAQVIDAAEEQAVVAALELQRRTADASIVVLTVQGLGARTVERYARDVFACWGVGARDRNDGVLILLAMADRKLRIEVGSGLRDRYTDDEAAAVIERMVPALRAGQVTQAVLTAVTLSAAEISGADVPEDPGDSVPEAPVARPGGGLPPGFDPPDYPAFPDTDPTGLPGPSAFLPVLILLGFVVAGVAILGRLLGVAPGMGRSIASSGPWFTGSRAGYRHLPGFDEPERRGFWSDFTSGGSSSDSMFDDDSGGASGSWSSSSSSSSSSGSDSSSGSSFGGGSSGGGGASGGW